MGPNGVRSRDHCPQAVRELRWFIFAPVARSQQLENLLQQTVQTLTEQLQAMQALCRNQDEHLQVRQEIQDLIDDWTDAQEAQLAWEEYDMTGVDGTLSYDEYREKRLGTETVV